MSLSICKRLSSFLFASLTILSLAAFAQTGTTSLHGTVFDESHSAIAGAKVTLVNAAQGLQRDTITPSTGEFEFLALPPGSYSLTVEKGGFSKYEQAALQLLVNVPTTANVTLRIGAVATRVEGVLLDGTISTPRCDSRSGPFPKQPCLCCLKAIRIGT
jgi:Carboxypeptidase regulatory-like domain